MKTVVQIQLPAAAVGRVESEESEESDGEGRVADGRSGCVECGMKERESKKGEGETFCNPRSITRSRCCLRCLLIPHVRAGSFSLSSELICLGEDVPHVLAGSFSLSSKLLAVIQSKLTCPGNKIAFTWPPSS